MFETFDFERRPNEYALTRIRKQDQNKECEKEREREITK